MIPLLYHYLFRVICFDYHICPIEYFMDTMQEYEVNTVIQNIPYLNRNEKELDRYKLFVSVQSNSKKKINIEDILKLPWDEEGKNTGTAISEEEAKKLRDKARELERKMNNGGMKIGTENFDMTQLIKNQ